MLSLLTTTVQQISKAGHACDVSHKKEVNTDDHHKPKARIFLKKKTNPNFFSFWKKLSPILCSSSVEILKRKKESNYNNKVTFCTDYQKIRIQHILTTSSSTRSGQISNNFLASFTKERHDIIKWSNFDKIN